MQMNKKAQGGVKLGAIIGALLFMLIGVILVPVITQSTAVAIDDPNTSSLVAFLLALVPVFYVLLVIIGGISFIVISARNL